MHNEGLEISYQTSGTAGCTLQDDFDMDGEDELDQYQQPFYIQTPTQQYTMPQLITTSNTNEK